MQQLAGKKIWIDVEEPKTGIMFHSLIMRLEAEGAKILITARDYDSTWNILDNLGLPFVRVGKHGGERLEDKLKTYIDRLNELLPHVTKFSPDFFLTFSSVEGARIAFGLQIPSIGYNDEPRNGPVCKLLFPFMDKIITPECIPAELYYDLHLDRDRIIRYNGIDEIAWLSTYTPNPSLLYSLNVEKGKFVLIRSEPSFASYFIDSLKPEQTQIAQFFPGIYNKFPDIAYFILVRTKKQEKWLKEQLKAYENKDNVVISRYMPNIVDLCYYSALVISGGGTIVRESALLDVPSIEFFPGDSAPQETWLIENGFPMEHIRDTDKIIARACEILQEGPTDARFTDTFKQCIMEFEDPNQICYNYLVDKLTSTSKSLE